MAPTKPEDSPRTPGKPSLRKALGNKIALRKDSPSKRSKSPTKPGNSPPKRLRAPRGPYKPRGTKAASGSSRASSSQASASIGDNDEDNDEMDLGEEESKDSSRVNASARWSEDEDDDDQDPDNTEAGTYRKKVFKSDGTEIHPNGRIVGRQLIRWQRARMMEKLILNLQYESHRAGIRLPWDKAVHRLEPGSTGQSALQYLSRMREIIMVEGHMAPPQLNKLGTEVLDPEVRGHVRDFKSEDPDAVRVCYWDENYENAKTSLPLPGGKVLGSGLYRKKEVAAAEDQDDTSIPFPLYSGLHPRGEQSEARYSKPSGRQPRIKEELSDDDDKNMSRKGMEVVPEDGDPDDEYDPTPTKSKKGKGRRFMTKAPRRKLFDFRSDSDMDERMDEPRGPLKSEGSPDFTTALPIGIEVSPGKTVRRTPRRSTAARASINIRKTIENDSEAETELEDSEDDFSVQEPKEDVGKENENITHPMGSRTHSFDSRGTSNSQGSRHWTLKEDDSVQLHVEGSKAAPIIDMNSSQFASPGMSTNGRLRESYDVQSPLQHGTVRGRDGHDVPYVMGGFPPGGRVGEPRESVRYPIGDMHGSRVYYAGAMEQNMRQLEGFRSTPRTPDSPETDDIPIGLGSGQNAQGVRQFGDVLGGDHGTHYNPALPVLSFAGYPLQQFRAFPPRTSSLGAHSTPLFSSPEMNAGFMAQEQQSRSFARHRDQLHQDRQDKARDAALGGTSSGQMSGSSEPGAGRQHRNTPVADFGSSGTDSGNPFDESQVSQAMDRFGSGQASGSSAEGQRRQRHNTPVTGVEHSREKYHPFGIGNSQLVGRFGNGEARLAESPAYFGLNNPFNDPQSIGQALTTEAEPAAYSNEFNFEDYLHNSSADVSPEVARIQRDVSPEFGIYEDPEDRENTAAAANKFSGFDFNLN